MRNREIRGSNSLVMSIPSFNRIANPFTSLNQTRYDQLAIKFKDPSNKKLAQAFIGDCK